MNNEIMNSDQKEGEKKKDRRKERNRATWEGKKEMNDKIKTCREGRKQSHKLGKTGRREKEIQGKYKRHGIQFKIYICAHRNTEKKKKVKCNFHFIDIL